MTRYLEARLVRFILKSFLGVLKELGVLGGKSVTSSLNGKSVTATRNAEPA